MPGIFHFGTPRRSLLGLRHPPLARTQGALLACAPLLQEGIRCQRALWSLAEALAAAGVDVLRFDWFGSGDSGGASSDIVVPGLVEDLASAESFLRTSSTASPDIRLLALRSAALPLLVHAGRCGQPVDVVLWAPVLDGAALTAAWREQHRRQLHVAGRFLSAHTMSDDDELLGFVLDRSLLDGLEALHGRDLPLPAGSRLLLAHWAASPVDQSFVDAQRAAGVVVEYLELDGADEPDWDDPDGFEAQIFPRRAVNQLAGQLAGIA